jgi:pimeloyl-ACP methyl ester carboxylesterase
MLWGALLATTLLAWQDISVSPAKGNSILAGWRASLAELDHPSERTLETLRRLDLDPTYKRNPEDAIDLLERAARREPAPDLVFALAELCWIEAQHIDSRRVFDRKREASSLERYIDTVAYAWDYLFDPELAAARNPSDPRYRLACDLYNGGLDRLFRAARARGPIQPGGVINLKIRGKDHQLRVALGFCVWQPGDVQELLPASDFQVTGLASRSRLYGLGVPLIGIKRTKTPALGADRFYPPETAFPLTAILRPNSKLREDPSGGDGARVCTLDLVDPIAYPILGPDSPLPEAAAAPAGCSLPLEADLTTPLAYMWSRTDLAKVRWTGLLRPGEVADRSGLSLIRPYDPDKIPVVMVHGLASSPLAWIPMLNELYRDPLLHRRYQFLLYLYPTGVPLPIAAAGLRDALNEAQARFDTPGDTPDREFQQMILLGHSMGGLLSHAMAVDSGNLLWETVTDRPFEEILGPPDVLAELRKYYFFETLPFIRRVVFLATPHRGSELSRKFVGRVGSNLISEPDHISKLITQLVKRNPEAFDRKRIKQYLPTSIETLSPDSEFLAALLAMKPAPGADVHFHSIIGSNKPGRVASTTDGVVSYASARFDSAESEKVVRSDHGVQKDPEAILEVRRILLAHDALDLASGRVPLAPDLDPAPPPPIRR